MLYFRIVFFVLFLLELRFLNFKYERDKYIWIGLVFIFSYIGYFFFLFHKRRLVIKRKFEPKFNRNK